MFWSNNFMTYNCFIYSGWGYAQWGIRAFEIEDRAAKRGREGKNKTTRWDGFSIHKIEIPSLSVIAIVLFIISCKNFTINQRYFHEQSILEGNYSPKRVQIWHIITLFKPSAGKDILERLNLGDSRILRNLFSRKLCQYGRAFYVANFILFFSP